MSDATTIAMVIGCEPFTSTAKTADLSGGAMRSVLKTFAGRLLKRAGKEYSDVNRWSMDDLQAVYRDHAAVLRLVGDIPEADCIACAIDSYRPKSFDPATVSPATVSPATPVATVPTPVVQDHAQQLAALIASIAGSAVNETRVIDLIRQHAPEATTAVLEVRRESAPAVRIESPHPKLATAMTILSAGCWPYLVGPAGCGKTTLAMQAAEAFRTEFYYSGAIDSPYKLFGFRDATGNYRPTPFRLSYEFGHLFLWDELDASDAQALVSLNAAIDNGVADFPDGMVKMHPDFKLICGANTIGNGQDRVYVGRNQLDGATIDRFAFVPMDYCPILESQLANSDAWVQYVQKLRMNARRLNLRTIISMRASIKGAALLRAGLDRATVEEAVIWRGLDADTRAKIRENDHAPNLHYARQYVSPAL